jgi:hypothetical protein
MISETRAASTLNFIQYQSDELIVTETVVKLRGLEGSISLLPGLEVGIVG